MHQILLVIQVLAGVAIVGLVLLQQGRGADAGAAFGSGASGSIFGARGPATFLSRATAVLVAVFFANSLAMAYMSSRTIERRSIVERYAPTTQGKVPTEPVPPKGTFLKGGPPTPASKPASKAPSDVPAMPSKETTKGATGDTKKPSN